METPDKVETLIERARSLVIALQRVKLLEDQVKLLQARIAVAKKDAADEEYAFAFAKRNAQRVTNLQTDQRILRTLSNKNWRKNIRMKVKL